jgi:hypothetical protein
MPSVTATKLAGELGLSKGRISQMVSSGQLEGCFTGEGRARRFDLGKVAAVLGQRLDPGQSMGNGAATKAALDLLKQDGEGTPTPTNGATRLAPGDGDGYHLARTQKAFEETRKLRRQNAEAEGLYVLAAEAQLEVKRLLSQEVAEFEQVLRDGARAIADELNVDFKTARKILVDKFRAHRDRRARALASEASEAELSETEQAEDI